MQATATREPKAAKTPKAVQAQALSRVVKTVPRPESLQKTAKELKLAGVYRVIHGAIEIVRPFDEWHHPDGTVIESEPKTIRAECVITCDKNGKFVSAQGDEVWLNDEDAYRLLAMDRPPEEREAHARVEALDAKPSRCGKVWKPPPVTQRS